MELQLEPHHQKIQQTVIGILKAANLDVDTELSVRNEAEKLLGVQLSDLDSKQLIRRIVESFLLSTSPADEAPVDDPNVGTDDGGGRIICRLAGQMRVSIEKCKGTKSVAIMEYYKKQKINLNPNEWSTLCSSFSDIDEAITKMQTEAGPSNPPKMLTYEADTCHPLIPITTTRFTGKNYYCWKRQMEFYLNQLNLFYVIVTPFPKSREQKWINDDYICRHTILNSLSDHLFDQFSVKPLNAKQLWDDLNKTYDNDYGTKTSHINNYINFQMIDGVSVLEQVHELHRIAGVIGTTGINIDEKFHIGVIISKLPPSWKHVQTKLMQQEFLTLDNLIYMLKDEEDSRSQQKRENGFKKKDMKGVCFGCRQEGHMRRDCPLTRPGDRDRSNQ